MGEGLDRNVGLGQGGGFGRSVGLGQGEGFGRSAGLDQGGGFGRSVGLGQGGGFDRSVGLGRGEGFGRSVGLGRGGDFDRSVGLGRGGDFDRSVGLDRDGVRVGRGHFGRGGLGHPVHRGGHVGLASRGLGGVVRGGDSPSKVGVWKADRPGRQMGVIPGEVAVGVQGRVMGRQPGRWWRCV